jgi:hypothetical protein
MKSVSVPNWKGNFIDLPQLHLSCQKEKKCKKIHFSIKFKGIYEKYFLNCADGTFYIMVDFGCMTYKNVETEMRRLKSKILRSATWKRER